MSLHWERQEFSVGRYVYVVMDSAGHRLCYVWETNPHARQFVEILCQSPALLPEVLGNLSPGKEVKAEAIRKILFGELKHENC